MTEEKAQEQTDIILGKREIEPKTELQTTPQNLLSQAIAQGLSIEHLEKLMNLQERWEKNQAIKAYYEAFAGFQSKCPVLDRQGKVDFETRTGGHTKYNFAELGYISEIIKPIMKECGLSYRFEFDDLDNGQMICWCIITHIQGHSERSKIKVGKDGSGNKNDIQSIGSARSYAQRYSLISALGLTTADEDNDGESSEKQREEPKAKTKSEKQPEKEKENDIKKLIEDTRTIKELANIWAGLSAGNQKAFKSVKDAQKEKIRLSIIQKPIEETDSIFDIEDKLKMLNTKVELDTFIRTNMKALDDLNNANINKQIQQLQVSLT